MIDPISISLIVGLSALLIERIFDYLKRIKKSKCLGTEISFVDSPKNNSHIEIQKNKILIDNNKP